MPNQSNAATEENVRDELVDLLIRSYDYSWSQIDLDYFLPSGGKPDVVIRNSDDTVIGIAEVKWPGKIDGLDQLSSYMREAKAYWGVWTNGSEFVCLKYDGSKIKTLDSIPKHGELMSQQEETPPASNAESSEEDEVVISGVVQLTIAENTWNLVGH